MATAIPALFASSATALPAGATAAALPAAGLGSSLAAGATITPVAAGLTAAAETSFLGSLATGLSIGSGVLSVAGGLQEQRILAGQAEMESFNAQQEILRGREDSIRLLQELNRNLAAQTVAAFASGLAPTGSVEAGKQQAIEQAKFETGITRDEAEIRAGARSQQAGVLRQQGLPALTGGIASGAGTIAQGVTRTVRR